MIKLLGNVLLIEPMPDADIQTSASGLFLVNKHRKTNLKFRVIAVGPGEFRKRTSPRTGRTRMLKVWDAPECSVGDCILSRAELDDGIVRHSFDDGTGRLIIYGHGVIMVWKQ